MISIIIPVYNMADRVERTLDSILKQSFRDLEVVVVDDGSSDHPENVIKKFAADYATAKISLKFFKQTNKGAPAARNYGMRESQGEYLFFCDADIELIPDAFNIMRNTLIANPSAAYAYPAFTFGNKLFRIWPFSAERLKAGPGINTMALVRRNAMPSGGWDKSIKKFQDWDLWLTLLENGHEGVWIDQVLYHAVSGGTMSVWLPAIAYKLLPFLPRVKKYNRALAIIKQKHQL
ncbi:MAG: glycosyltransferase family A protein [Candidatus Falkowbacteria bacterium]